MKIRSGFVSNSSSSSFTCLTCNQTFNGWDASPRDFDHLECVKGHIFCEDYLFNRKLFEELKEKFENFNKNDLPSHYWEEPDYLEKYGIGDDDLYEIPSKFCPVCNFSAFSPTEVINYLFKRDGLTMKKIFEEIKSKFSSYDEFNKFLYG